MKWAREKAARAGANALGAHALECFVFGLITVIEGRWWPREHWCSHAEWMRRAEDNADDALELYSIVSEAQRRHDRLMARIRRIGGQ